MATTPPPPPPPEPPDPPPWGTSHGGGISPPPPGLPERLVAQSGFVVYEGGNSIFDETVLVYVARPRKEWPDFDVFDHVGRPLGISRLEHRRAYAVSQDTTVFYDQAMNQILRLEPRIRAFSTSFAISGVARGGVTSGASTFGNLVIRPDDQTTKPGPYRAEPTKATPFGPAPNTTQHYGSIVGPKFRGLTAPSLAILDQQKNQVGEIRGINERRWLPTVRHYVISVEPTLRGELRRLLVAMPTIITTVIRQQQAAS